MANVGNNEIGDSFCVSFRIFLVFFVCDEKIGVEKKKNYLGLEQNKKIEKKMRKRKSINTEQKRRNSFVPFSFFCFLVK